MRIKHIGQQYNVRRNHIKKKIKYYVEIVHDS